jgi:hypothetical protein
MLFGLAFVYFRFFLDWNSQPFCHRVINGEFLQLMHPQGGDITHDPKPYPNVKGLSEDSLATVNGYRDWAKDYNYIPGLREDDPQDLVLMYFNRPTHWNWHGEPPSVFREKEWIIIAVGFPEPDSFHPRAGQFGELSERVSSDEFRVRLKRTLDFIRTNGRPNWQAIVAEHTKFLDSITNQFHPKSK